MSPPPETPVLDDSRDALALGADENADLCAGCVRCCSYVSVEIDKPRTPREYDQWMWALHHRNVSIYVESPESWHIVFDTVCERLGADGRCTIHGRHPVLCREYDPRSCERRLPLNGIVAWFHDAAALEAWLREKRPRHWARLTQWRERAAASSGPPAAAGFVPLDTLATRRTRRRTRPAAGPSESV